MGKQTGFRLDDAVLTASWEGAGRRGPGPHARLDSLTGWGVTRGRALLTDGGASTVRRGEGLGPGRTGTVTAAAAAGDGA